MPLFGNQITHASFEHEEGAVIKIACIKYLPFQGSRKIANFSKYGTIFFPLTKNFSVLLPTVKTEHLF